MLKKIIGFKIIALAFWSFQSFAQSQIENIRPLTDSFLLSLNQETNHKTVLEYGKIEGHVYVPEGVDPSSVIIQVGAVNNFNQTSEDFYTSPNQEGHFAFENTFTIGSSLNLIFWDQKGLLNKRALPVFISKYSGSYDVYLEKSSITAALAESFGRPQDFTKAGLCGRITGLSTTETIGSEVYLQDSSYGNKFTAQYFDDNNLPSSNQNYLSQNGNFCFFNVESANNSFLYSLKLKLNDGILKSFFVYLPSYTFENNIEFDASSALFRPIQIFAWDNNKYYYKLNSNADLINWHSAYNVSFSTSPDYSPIIYNENTQNEAVYFPLSDEFLNINYNLSDENKNHFFLFSSRTSLFNKKIINSTKDFSPGQVYIDQTDPVVLKIFNPQVLQGKNLNKLSPLFNENLGSLFLNFDTTDFNFDKKNIKFYLKNISAQDVSFFVALNPFDNKKELSGFFYNLPEGLYQLFVTVPSSVSNCDNCTTFNSNEKLLWSSLVESVANKTQVLTNITDNKILIENKLSLQSEKEDSSDKMITYKESTQKITVDIIPSIQENGQYPQALNIFPNLNTRSIFYEIDEKKLCSVPEKIKENLFMNLVPFVNLLLPSHLKPVSTKKISFVEINNFFNINSIIKNDI